MRQFLPKDASPKARAVFMARHTMSMTIVAAIGRLDHFDVHGAGRGRNGRKLLWIIGAREAMEGELARGGWLGEPLAKLCPCSCGWELLLIGPEMQAWELERSVSVDGGQASSVRIVAHSGTLHSLRADAVARPDAAVLFNSGIGTLLWPLVETWLPTMVQLLALDVPVLLSCFNAREAYGEALILKQLQARVLAAAALNPLACSTPLECALAFPKGGEDAAAHERRVAALALAAVQQMRQVDSEGQERDLFEGSSVHSSVTVSGEATTAGAAAGGAAAGGTKGGGGTLVPWREGPGGDEQDGQTVSSQWVKWVGGSELAPSELHAPSTIDSVRETVRGYAKLYAVRNMEAWVRGLGVDEMHAGCASPAADRSETFAANAMLIAEAVVELPLALLAMQHGAAAALAKLLEAHGRPASTPPREGGAMALSYAGASAAERIVSACTAALGRLAEAHHELRSLGSEPTGTEAPMARAAYRNVFPGEYINVREAPTTGSPVVARLLRGVELHAVAERAGWLRLEAPANAWVLIAHPMHGTLLERVGLAGA